jgi:hypothetical protein
MKTSISNLLIVLALIVSGSVARSATITWTNAAGGDWNNAQNWDLNQVPGSGDSASIPGGGINVIINSANSIGSLTLGNGSSLTIASNAVLNIEDTMYVSGELTNAGTVNWQGGQIWVYNDNGVSASGVIWNNAGALWDIQCDQVLSDRTGNWQFHNAGVLQKDTTTGTTSFGAYLDNSGTVHAESGTIAFSGGSDLGGSFQADNNAVISFNGGYYVCGSEPNFQGPGPVQFIGGANVTLNGLVGPFTLNGANLYGQNTVYGTLNLVSGAILNGSSLTIASNAVLNIEDTMYVSGELTNAGTVNWQGGQIWVYNDNGVSASGVIWNNVGALWDIQCDQVLSDRTGNWQFHNAGVLQKDTTTGTTSFGAYLDNSGILDAQAGTISLNGSYTETASARQVIGIGGTTPDISYGQIQFLSPTFAGSFDVALLNGFRPSPGDSFSVLSYPSLTGDFTSMNGLDLGNGLQLVPHFSNTGLTLVAISNPTNTQPSLSLYLTSSGTLVSWPLNFTDWQLQTATNLATPVWIPVTVAGTNNTIVPRTGPQGFFRLMSN